MNNRMDFFLKFLGKDNLDHIINLRCKALIDGKLPKTLLLPKIGFLGMEVRFHDKKTIEIEVTSTVK